MSDLTGRAVRSTVVVFTAQLATRFLTFGRMVVIARLLEPTEFGRFALAAAVMAGLDVAANPGIHDALISAQEPDEDTYNVAWTALIGRGLLITAVLWAMSGPVAALLGHPESASVLRILAFIPAVSGFSSLAPVARAREVDLQPSLMVSLGGTVVATAVSIAAVWTRRDAAGLAVGLLAGAGAQVGFSFLVRGFRPRLRIERARMRTLVAFGRWRFASFLLGYVATQGDDLLVGKLAGTAPLGTYRAAYGVANLPTTEVASTVSRVAFPFLSRARDGDGGIDDLFLRYVGLLAAISGILAVLVALTAHDLVVLLLGDAYGAAVVPVAVMSVAGFLRAILSASGHLALASGRPKLEAKVQIWRAVGLLALIWLVIPFGIVGAAVASLGSLVAAIPPAWSAVRAVGHNPRAAARAVLARLPALGCGAIAVASATWLLDGAVSLVVSWVVGFLVWAAAVAAFDAPVRQDLQRVVARMVRRPR